VIAGGALVVLRTRLSLTVPEDRRTRRNGWQLGVGPLAGVTIGVFVVGVGVGGVLGRIQPPSWDTGLERLVDLTPEPMEEPEGGWEEVGVEPSALPQAEPAWPEGESEALAPTAADPVDPSPAGDPAPGDAPPTGLDPGDAVSVPLPEAVPDSARPIERLEPRFAVRAGVFRDRVNADDLQEELRGVGYPPLIVQREDSDGNVVFWVYAGTFATRESADVAVRELSTRGVQAIVVNISEVREGG
jgi:cell division septation protein DedD